MRLRSVAALIATLFAAPATAQYVDFGDLDAYNAQLMQLQQRMTADLDLGRSIDRQLQDAELYRQRWVQQQLEQQRRELLRREREDEQRRREELRRDSEDEQRRRESQRRDQQQSDERFRQQRRYDEIRRELEKQRRYEEERRRQLD